MAGNALQFLPMFFYPVGNYSLVRLVTVHTSPGALFPLSQAGHTVTVPAGKTFFKMDVWLHLEVVRYI